ncbi:MAG: carbon-nitrogen hydrolase family protein [Agriterribacter sp.]
MKIAVAQIKPEKGNISDNIEKHKELIDLAAHSGARGIIFPELSLTGYEPELAKALAINTSDNRLDIFQKWCSGLNLTICVGAPIRAGAGVQIGMIIFQPGHKRKLYAKQLLHDDELPFFIKGTKQIVINIENQPLLPAICYESLQPEHAVQINSFGAALYIASVAKSQKGIDKAYLHYPSVAKQYSIPVLMSNCIGLCDNFESMGLSAAWNKKGDMLAHLDSTSEGVIVFDTTTETAVKSML